MDPNWVVPIAGYLLKNPELVTSTWGRINNIIFKKKVRIAFTGMSGVGKTVLFDQLTGKGLKPEYPTARPLTFG
jgi:GTPase SAR1 family protein